MARGALFPHLVQQFVLPAGVHRHPPVLVLVALQLPVLGQPHQRLALEVRLPCRREAIEEGAAKDEEPAVDRPRGDLRFLGETGHLGSGQRQLAEAGDRPHAGHRAQPIVGLVEIEEARDVDVGQPVSVGQHEVLVVLHVAFDALDALARRRRVSGLDQRDRPVLLPVLAEHPAGRGGAQPHLDVGDHRLVVEEELLDQPASVAQGEHELLEAEVRVDLHDVPQDRTSADPDQRLGDALGHVLDARTAPPAEDHDLHDALRLPRRRRNSSKVASRWSSWVELNP